MYFNKDDRNIFLMILTILIVSIISLIAIINGVWRLIGPGVEKIAGDISHAIQINRLDYNFAVPPSTNTTSINVTPQPQPVPKPSPAPAPAPLPQPSPVQITIQPNPQPQTQNNNADIDVAKLNLNYNFVVPPRPPEDPIAIDPSFPDAIVDDAILGSKGTTNNQPVGDLRIVIPRMKVNSPVLQGRDSTSLLKQGFWVYPSSYELGKGEVVMLCHRRYFGRHDPRSCWYIDRMQKGDEIFMYYNGNELKYRVVGINIFNGEDPLIYATSPGDDYIKISACTPLYSNKQRLVVLAKRVTE